MTLEEIRDCCLSMKGVTEDIKWETHLCFCVGEKIFIITAPDEVPVTASLKVSDENFNKYKEQPGFAPAPYLARYKWIFVENIKTLPKAKGIKLLNEAYSLVASKLNGKTKKELGLH